MNKQQKKQLAGICHHMYQLLDAPSDRENIRQIIKTIDAIFAITNPKPKKMFDPQQQEIWTEGDTIYVKA